MNSNNNEVPAPGWNQSGSLAAKPPQGWLHPDEAITGDGVRFHVNYVGYVSVKESMRNLDFDKRTSLTREAICKVVQNTNYKLLQDWIPDRNNLSSILDSACMPGQGARALLTVSTEAIRLVALDAFQTQILQHDMCSISFASGGDGETAEFIGYVAKGVANLRACHVVEVPNMAADVIATIGQAFELRYKQHIASRNQQTKIQNQPIIGASVGAANSDGILRTNGNFISPESKWGCETASMMSDNNNMSLNQSAGAIQINPQIPSSARNSGVFKRYPSSCEGEKILMEPSDNRRSFVAQCFDDDFVSSSNKQQNVTNGFNKPMVVNTDRFSLCPQPLPGLANVSPGANFPRNVTNPHGVFLPNGKTRPLQTFQTTQSSPPVPAPRKSVPGSTPFQSNSSSQINNPVCGINQPAKRLSNEISPPKLPERMSPKDNHRDPQNGLGSSNDSNGSHHSKKPTNTPSKAVTRLGDDDDLILIPQMDKVLPIDQQTWFHGPITRPESEQRLKRDGDFLVREKPSGPNETRQYVLSGFQSGAAKHLLLIDPSGRVRTKHNIFESVSHLITHHMKNNIPIISSDSQVKLGNPVKRPLRPGLHTTDL